MKSPFLLIFLLTIVSFSCAKERSIVAPVIPLDAYVSAVSINGRLLTSGGTAMMLPVDSVVVRVTFSSRIDLSHIDPGHIYINNGVDTSFVCLPETDDKVLSFKVRKRLNYHTSYAFSIDSGEVLGVHIVTPFKANFITQLDPTPKFSKITDDELLTLVQKQTFKYFWDYGHPVSGLARERYNAGETTTIGGSGFGVMTIPVAVERGFITRAQGLQRLTTIVDFLTNKADKFHGAFSHWLNGTTGKVIPFGTNDDGADLVETAYLMQGLLTVQQYFNASSPDEQALRQKIQLLWQNVEWNWFQQNGQQVLYWHWSPNAGWAKNLPISGWNEALIVYVLAASSPTHPITKSVYDQGWAKSGNIKNGKIFYGVTLPLGQAYGGSLFFTHYSFLGLDPRKLSDAYATYWTQNTAHARINYNYCVANPNNFYGYGASCWGLTASDIQNGYTASSPTHDVGVIAPTAALSSFPYTPVESMQALRFFYYTLGDRLWGNYGFKDAFNLSTQWIDNGYISIDQGPIIVMIENYRTALLWNLFMQNADIHSGLSKLGFSF